MEAECGMCGREVDPAWAEWCEECEMFICDSCSGPCEVEDEGEDECESH